MRGITPEPLAFAALFRAALLLTLLFSACIGLIRAQPRDDSHLRAFLTPPDGCPMPCFMGIRPGVTRADEALATLAVHEWLREPMVSYNRGGEIYLIQWSWGESAPPLLDKSKRGYVFARDGVVRSISMPTTIAFADIWLMLGTPDRGGIESPERPATATFFQIVGYLDGSMAFESMVTCPVTLAAVFQTRVSIFFLADMEARFGSEAFQLSEWVRLHPCDARRL